MSESATLACPPWERVTITYRLHDRTEEAEFELPLKLLVLGDHTSRLDPRPLARRAPIAVDKDNFEKVMSEQDLAISFTVKDKLSGGGGGELNVDLSFRNLSDMDPEGVARQVPEIKEVLRRRAALTTLDSPIGETIEEIDDKLSLQVDEILHHPTFQALESAWRGLALVVARTNFRENIEIFMVNCSKEDLRADFEGSPGALESGLYEIVYGRDGAFHERPFAAIIANYEIGPSPEDVNLLRECASVAAMAHAPFFAAAAPSFFGLEDYSSLSNITDPKALLRQPRCASFQALRETDNARYVGLLLPRFLLRLPHGSSTVPVKAFHYEEDVIGKRRAYCWGNAAHAFAIRLSDSFARYRWGGGVVGSDMRGIVQGLALHQGSAGGQRWAMGPTEAALTDEVAQALSEEGFIGFVSGEGSGDASFLSASSIQKPKLFDQSEEGRSKEMNDYLKTQLPWVFVICRFAHYLKVMHREQMGSWNRDDIERELNDWIGQYVADGSVMTPEVRRQRPLRIARIIVTDVEGAASYELTLKIRPNVKHRGCFFQLSLVGKLDKACPSRPAE